MLVCTKLADVIYDISLMFQIGEEFIVPADEGTCSKSCVYMDYCEKTCTNICEIQCGESYTLVDNGVDCCYCENSKFSYVNDMSIYISTLMKNSVL